MAANQETGGGGDRREEDGVDTVRQEEITETSSKWRT